MKGCGLQQSNIIKVFAIGPSKTAKRYCKRGANISRPFGSAIDHHTWKDDTLKEAIRDSPRIQAYISRVKELYKECLPLYLKSHGLCENAVREYIDATQQLL